MPFRVLLTVDLSASPAQDAGPSSGVLIVLKKRLELPFVPYPHLELLLEPTSWPISERASTAQKGRRPAVTGVFELEECVFNVSQDEFVVFSAEEYAYADIDVARDILVERYGFEVDYDSRHLSDDDD